LDGFPFSKSNILRFERCCNCGFTRNISFDKNKINDFYSENHSGYVGSTQFLETEDANRHKYKVYLGFISEYFSNGDWLDIGCGEGALLRYSVGSKIFPKEVNFTGIDYGARRLIDKDNYPEIDYYDQNSEGLSISKPYDLYTMFHVLEHLQDPIQFLRIIHTSGHIGSVLILEVPDSESYQNHINQAYWFTIFEHINHFSLTSLIRLGHCTGWKCEEFKRYKGNAVGIEYPALLVAFSWVDISKPKLKLEDEIALDAKNIALELISLSKKRKICLWGYSKFAKYIATFLKTAMPLYDSFCVGKYESNEYIYFIDSPPSINEYELIICTSITGFESVKSDAIACGWSDKSIISILNLPSVDMSVIL
jgi:2-polyprenyl-3-methyl-5-hydroxy-6-metoxy-1,4-benzoquinol methylase